MSNKAGTISGTKTALKEGGPTDSLPNPSASINKGYKVPRITDPAATAIKTLLVSNRDSREMRSNRPPNPILGARSAYRNNEVPTTTVNSSKMNTPLRGSVAKACTEVSTPRSEEHTSELQSLMRISYAVFCLKKK